MDPAKSILIVDDDPLVHRMLALVLESHGWHIDSAYDGLDGWERAKVKDYDLILTDVHMPGMNGLDLLQRIHEVRPAAKVMVMTADSTPAHVIFAIRSQAFSYFSKPFVPTAVAEMIAHALDAPSWEDDVEVVSARPEWITLRVRCKIAVADRILQFLRELKVDLPVEEQEDIASAFREMLLNGIEHGGGSDPQKRVQVTYVRTSRAILYHVQDPGRGFSLASLPHAAVSSPDDPFRHTAVRNELGMRPGGFGILLTGKLVDELIYNEKGNEVLLIKYLPNGKG